MRAVLQLALERLTALTYTMIKYSKVFSLHFIQIHTNQQLSFVLKMIYNQIFQFQYFIIQNQLVKGSIKYLAIQ